MRTHEPRDWDLIDAAPENLQDFVFKFSDRSFMYVVAAGEKVKIGRSVNPEGRISGLQTSSPVRLEVLATVPEYVCSERDAHNLFAANRLHGEWFNRTPEIDEWTRRLGEATVAAERIRARVLTALERKMSPRRPLKMLRIAEHDLVEDRIRQRREEEYAREVAAGCVICGEKERLGRVTTTQGLFCGRCKSWYLRLEKTGSAEERSKLIEALEKARQKLAEHDWRTLRLAAHLRSRPPVETT